MDSALKQDAIIAEVTAGTTPATPAFKILRTINITGGRQRPIARSPERTPHRQLSATTEGLIANARTIVTPWVRDDGLDVLWQSLLNSTFVTDVIKNGSTPLTFTLEEKYKANPGGTDWYRRLAGCYVDSLAIAFRQDGSPGQMTWNVTGLAETASETAIVGATYADPSPGLDPITASEIVANDVFSLASPEVMNFQISITNALRSIYGFGDPNPASIGRGMFDVSGTIEFYLEAMADYATFLTKQTGLTLQLTLGSVTNSKDILEVYSADVANPSISDPGQTGDHMVSLEFLGKYESVTNDATIQLTRNAA